MPRNPATPSLSHSAPVAAIVVGRIRGVRRVRRRAEGRASYTSARPGGLRWEHNAQHLQRDACCATACDGRHKPTGKCTIAMKSPHIANDLTACCVAANQNSSRGSTCVPIVAATGASMHVGDLVSGRVTLRQPQDLYGMRVFRNARCPTGTITGTERSRTARDCKLGRL
jgi:hypothetical protein